MIYRMKNTIQNYLWGSVNAMRDYLGYDNTKNEPQAELWMGAHPKSPSKIEISKNYYVSLNDFIKNNKAFFTTDREQKKIKQLPYLFKVLAAETPLSIQAHPSSDQAVRGFRRENENKIPLDSFNRNYKDENHKPEIICALTEYHAMLGFRDINEIEKDFALISIPQIENEIKNLQRKTEKQLKHFFLSLMQLQAKEKLTLINNAISLCKKCVFTPEQNKWIEKFNNLYPGDIGILSPLYLNIVRLLPGDALFLPAGQLHAYLSGMGIELMANSDNVLRGGLTQKYIDIPELVSVLDFKSVKPEILQPEKIGSKEYSYKTSASEFVLSKIKLKDEKYNIEESSERCMQPSIFLCTDGRFEIIDSSSNKTIDFACGDSIFADTPGSLILNGSGIIYRASVPA